jgi:hypothetical protein
MARRSEWSKLLIWFGTKPKDHAYRSALTKCESKAANRR